MKITQFWKQYLISIILVTFGYFIIYQKLNLIPNWSVFVMWVPVTWVMVLGLAFIFNLILNYGDKD